MGARYSQLRDACRVSEKNTDSLSYLDLIATFQLIFMFSYPPYFDDIPFKIYEKILQGKLEFPKYVDSVGKYARTYLR